MYTFLILKIHYSNSNDSSCYISYILLHVIPLVKKTIYVLRLVHIALFKFDCKIVYLVIHLLSYRDSSNISHKSFIQFTLKDF